MKVASLRKTVVYSIIKAMEEYTCGQAKKRARAYINQYRRRDYSVLRKIHHASHENFILTSLQTKKRILLMGIYSSIKYQNTRFPSLMNNHNRHSTLPIVAFGSVF